MTEIDILRLINNKAPVSYSDIYKNLRVGTRDISAPMARLRNKNLVQRVDLPEGPLWICTEGGLRRLEEDGRKSNVS